MTVAATTTHSAASWAVTDPSTDADTNTAGHQVDLDAGDDNEVEITVTAEDTTTSKTYTVNIDRGSTTDYEWNAAADFNTLDAASNDAPSALWSNGTTMWVGDAEDYKIFAYNMADKSRDASKDFSRSQLQVGDQTIPVGIWSDGNTLWVAYAFSAPIRAFNLTTKARMPSNDIVATSTYYVNRISDIWSDSETMWISDWIDNKIYAFDIASDTRVQDKEFDSGNLDAGNTQPAGIWSDGTTIWVRDSEDDKLYAYNLHTKAREADKDVDDIDDHGNASPAPCGATRRRYG